MGYKSFVKTSCKIVLKVPFKKNQFCVRERCFGPWHRIKTARIHFISCKLLRHSVKFLYLPLTFTAIPRSGTETTSRVARMSFFFERHNAPKVLNLKKCLRSLHLISLQLNWLWMHLIAGRRLYQQRTVRSPERLGTSSSSISNTKGQRAVLQVAWQQTQCIHTNF